jgi:two-component system cell cycle sensor histidine kinase/response regulator CckA
MASNGPFGNDRSPQFSALMVAHLANDLRLLLGAMLNCVDSIRAKIPSSVDVEEDFAAFETAIDNAFYLSRELIALGAPKTGEPGVLDVNDLLRRARGMLERVLGPRVRLVYDLSATSPTVRADAVQLEWMLLNLAVNGRDAMADGGTLTIETTSIDTAPKDVRTMSRYQSYVRLTVRDTGSGIIPDVQLRMFEPFFTTKPGGTGLGLTGVAMTSRLLNGSLHVRSNEPHGTEVNIYLPVVTRDT